jgi:O-antigen/teichoic acid export membrane protein
MSLVRSLTRGALWVAATRAIINLASFANTLLLAHFLVPADFGLVALATTVTTIITSVTELSLSSALVQLADPVEQHFHTAWTLNFIRGGLIALLIAALSVPVARLYGDPRLVGIMLVIAVTTLISGAVNPKMAVFSRALMFRQDFILGVSQRVAGLLTAIVLVVITRSYWALVASLLATQIAALVVSYLLRPYRPRLQLTRARELMSFSVWLTFAQVANTLNFKFDQLVIGYFLGNAKLGFYTVGDTLAVLPTREATTPLAQTLFPGFVRLAADRPRLRRAYQRAQAALCAVGLPVGFGFAVVAGPLIQLTMGAKWQPVVFVIQYLACIFAVQTVASGLQALAMGLGETRRLFWRDVLILGVRVPLVIVGLWLGGLKGIVYARCVSGTLSLLLNLAMARGLLDLPIRQQLAANLRSALATLCMVAGGYFLCGRLAASGVSGLVGQIAATVCGAGLIYVGSLYGLWRATGRPDGPEAELLRMLGKVRQEGVSF